MSRPEVPHRAVQSQIAIDECAGACHGLVCKVFWDRGGGHGQPMVLLGIQRKEGQQGPHSGPSLQRGRSRLACRIEPVVSIVDAIKVPGRVLRGLLGENPGRVGGVERGGAGAGVLLAEEFAEGALHRLVLSHAGRRRPRGRRGHLPGSPCPARVSTSRAPPGGPYRAMAPPSSQPARRGQVLRVPPLAWKCELPGQVRGGGRVPAPPRGSRPAAQLPGPHSFLPPSTTGHCWRGPVGCGPRPASETSRPAPRAPLAQSRLRPFSLGQEGAVRP